MQEEAIVFSRAYGFRVVLIPIRASRTEDEAEEAIEINGNRRAPAAWLSMPGERTISEVESHAQIHPDIDRQIERIAEERLGDLFLSDSQRQAEKLHQTGLSMSDVLICYLTLTMLVPTGNPHHFDSVRDVLGSNRRLGIVDPALDGLGEASWAVLGRIVPGGESAIPMELIQLYERQYDLLEALEQRQIDAALVWNATSQRNFLLIKYADEYNADPRFVGYLREAERQRNQNAARLVLREMSETLFEERRFAEEVALTENPDERWVVAARLVVLSSTSNHGFSKRFSDFIRSNQGREILRRFGFAAQ